MERKYENANDKATEMNTLSTCMNKCRKEGYMHDFKVNTKGLHPVDSEEYYVPGQVHINNFYRFEGESDPADSAILYAIETDDHQKGLLLDAYGAYADEKINKFIREVETVNKKTDGNNK